MRQLQKELAASIKKAKRKFWKNTFADLEENPFGNAYKTVMTVMRQLRKPILSYNINDEETNRIVCELIPSAEDEGQRYGHVTLTVKPFDMKELESARNKMKAGKAAVRTD